DERSTTCAPKRRDVPAGERSMNSAPASAPLRAPAEGRGPADDIQLHHEIQQWLYREARLLDGERFREWLSMLAPEIHYWLQLRENRFRRDRRPEPTPSTSASVFNDDLHDLELRIKRFDTGLVWSEDPAPRVCRSVTNVEIAGGGEEGLLVYSNI